MTSPTATVTILTFNGERYLDAILTSLEGQVYDGEFDVLVVDSGSTDGTLGVVANHPSVILHEIANSDFGHGKTRNLAASLATGEIVAYLTHDAVPAHPRWLAELMAPFADDSRVAAVIGKQAARPGAAPVLKYDIRRVFERIGPDYGVTTVWDTGRPMPDGERIAASFYSDANSAARRSILLEKVPYQDVSYAEDQLFGRDLFDAGYRKAYAPQAVVEHSNDMSLRTFGARIAADLAGLRAIGTDIGPVTRLTAFKQFVKWSTVDAAYIVVDKDYGVGEKLRWLFTNPWYHAAKWGAYRKAALGAPPSASDT